MGAGADVVPLGLIASWGGGAVSLATFGTEWDAELDVTRVVSRVSGCDGSEGMDVARKDESLKEIQSSDMSEHSIGASTERAWGMVRCGSSGSA